LATWHGEGKLFAALVAMTVIGNGFGQVGKKFLCNISEKTVPKTTDIVSVKK
jgi:hypothetical protein